MLETFQREMNIGRIACIYHVFFLRQKLNLLNNIINSENFACLDKTLADVCNFLLMEEEEEE